MVYHRHTQARYPQPVYILQVRPALSTDSDFTVAITAIHWSALTGLERYFSFLPTLRAYCGEHLASRPVAVIAIAAATVSVLPCFPFLATWGTTLRLVSIASWRKLLLFPSAENEGGPTIGTLDRLVLKTHWMTSSLRNSSWSWGHPILHMNPRWF